MKNEKRIAYSLERRVKCKIQKKLAFSASLNAPHSTLNASSAGFTLPEVLIYIAVLVVLLLAIVYGMSATMRIYRDVQAAKNVESAAVTAFDRLTREIRYAESVTVGASTLDTHPGELLFTGYDEWDAATTTRFYLDSGTLKLDIGGVYQGPLTPQNVEVTNLVFRHANASTSQVVKIEMDIESTVSGTTRNQSFYSSVVLRRSY